ncbi:hypothetical protein NP233_g3004 [Leucocoprinus birnbaumii]|uniref:ATP-dependent RNA helicase n=1 Tax=Leucocoprinus birnbaumii TaxID=56174 RepID=A0AAD5VZU7_9AGAR|nr:hypothetical protein NP233_g3004 [Leucocoprinus birnbaumii]
MAEKSVTSPAAHTGSKTKTKAKKRYLRRKKERRKVREKQRPNVADASKAHGADGSSESDLEDDQDVGDKDVSAPIITQQDVDPESRPPKRRKTIQVGLNVKANQELERVDEDIIMAEAEEPAPSIVHRTPTPPLPIFPLPALPNAPSKSALAIQGLDKALIDAELVEPDNVMPIPAEGTDDGGSRLSEKTRKRLHESGITELFAVQTSLLPFLLPSSNAQSQLYLSHQLIRDVCVSAPTGSGKTLAMVTQLRALIVLPTRDLVMQVRETFEVLGKGRGLKVGTATGQHSFSHEQAQLVNDLSSNLLGGSSRVDVLICTPGRLIDHLNGTPNFTLQHLRFLVIDEADRLLAQSFQDWLAQVLSATRASNTPKDFFTSQGSLNLRPDIVAPNMLPQLPYPHIPTFLTESPENSCQKMLFSATLTRDPGKIAALQLREPKYFVVQKSKDTGDENRISDVVMEKFSMPSTLQENMVVCESSQKPLMFFHLVFDQNVTDALVFTKSAESTARLVRLFNLFQKEQSHNSDKPPLVARAYSSDLPVGERKSILEQFRAQEIHILICSDLISRGIDISHVSHVVSYDAPIDMRKYVHRVGRTARAGRSGCAWTLVEEQEARYFKNMLREADHFEQVKRLRVSDKDVAALKPAYELSLRQLKDAYARS